MSLRKDKKNKNGLDFSIEDLIDNEEEREKLERMTEIQRETYIAEKRQRKTEELEREILRRKQISMEDRKQNVTQMEKKKNIIKHDENLDDSDYESGEISKSSSSDGEEDEASNSSAYALSMSSDEKPKSKNNLSSISVSDIQKILIKRNFIEKNYDLPMFDSTIKDAFVKINMNSGRNQSSGYLLGQIKQVIDIPDKPYNFMGKSISKYLSVNHANSNKNFTYFVISNSQLNEHEFKMWNNRMTKHKLELPNIERINEVYNAIKKVYDQSFTNEEVRKIINLKKDTKLKNKERNMNITHELAGVQEQYNATIQKLKEATDEKTRKEYEEKRKEIYPKLEILSKMAAEREEEDFKKSEIDRIAIINKKNKEKQKIIDSKHSLLNRKKNRENIQNQYRRKGCAPANLYDSGYLKRESKNVNDKDEKSLEKKAEEKKKIILEPEEEEKQIILNKAELLKRLEENILGKSKEIDEIFRNKNNEINKKINNCNDEEDFIFSCLPFEENLIFDLIKQNNNRINHNSKRLTLDEIDI